MHNPYSQKEDDFIKRFYYTKGTAFCAQHLGRTMSAIIGHRRVLGFPNPTKGRGRKHGPRNVVDPSLHKVPHTQFVDVKTPEVAYILGLIWADGYVHDTKVVLSCVREDGREYLPTFAKTGRWNIDNYQRYRYGVKAKPNQVLRIGNVLLARHLRSLGYGAKSTQSAEAILDTIPAHLRHYWFRGLLDGDGYLVYSKRGIFAVRITSSYEQDWKHVEDLCDGLGIKYQIRRDRYINRHGKVNQRSVFAVTNAAGIKKLLEYMYQGVEQDKIGLSRKRLKWQEMREYMRSRPRLEHLFMT